MAVVAHAVRDFGRPTEPFILHRVRARMPGYANELWTEIERVEPQVTTRHVRMRWARSGSCGDRAYHLAPRLAGILARDYRSLEATSRPSLIHAHYVPTGCLVGSVTRSPMVVSAYGWDLSTLPRRGVWAAAIRRLAGRIERLLVEGPYMRESAISLGMRPEQVSIVRISAGLQDVAFRPPRTEPSTAPQFICPGRMVEKKGHEYALRAFAKLVPTLPSASRLVLVGDGRLEPMLRDLAGKLAVEGSVHFTGSVPREQYLELQARADIMLAPSVTGPNGDSEGGAPTTILDAQAMGTITIGSRHADIPYLVEDGVTGFLSEERDIDGLAATIQRALALRAEWPAISAAARTRAIDLHSDAAVSRSLKQVYDEVLTSA